MSRIRKSVPGVDPKLLEILVWVSAACLVVAIGLSRVYLGVHHPTDVLAGFLAAGIWVSSIVALDHIRLLRRRRPAR